MSRNRFHPIQFSKLNKQRCEESYFKIDDWTPTDWGCALAGEVGELCNMLKKLRRNEFSVSHLPDSKFPVANISKEDLAGEIGGIYTYLDILCQRLDINIGEAIVNEFDKVSDRVGSTIKIGVTYDLG